MPESLKRSRESSPDLAMNGPSSSQQVVDETKFALFPPLPPITGDIILETFTHRTLRFEGAVNADQFSDNQRLAELGDQLLKLVATNSVYHRRSPAVKAVDMSLERDILLQQSRINEWVSMYKLRDRLRYLPSEVDITTPTEGRDLFCAYAGAVFVQSGMDVVSRWLSQLLDPENIPPFSDESSSSVSSTFTDHLHITKRHRNNNNTGTPVQSSTSSSPQAPDIPPPPLPTGNPATSLIQPPTVQQNNNAFLPKFNLICSQRKINVEYLAENMGLPHAPNWVMKCMVNGIQKGQGAGSSKQIAKEAAAKEAYTAMGWANLGI